MTTKFIAEPFFPSLEVRRVAQKSVGLVDAAYIEAATWPTRQWFAQTFGAYEPRPDQRPGIPCNPVATTRVT